MVEARIKVDLGLCVGSSVWLAVDDDGGMSFEDWLRTSLTENRLVPVKRMEESRKNNDLTVT
jgi:hypothetical protein